MLPALGADTRAALCASEDGGAHPRAIAARLSGRALDGTKRFVTGARDADALLVLAARGESEGGRRDLVLARVDPDAPGVRFEDMPATPSSPTSPTARSPSPARPWGRCCPATGGATT